MCHKLPLFPDSAAESFFDSSGPIYLTYSLPESEQYDEKPFAFDLSKFKVCSLDAPDGVSSTMSEELTAIDETCFGLWPDL
jgi:hypothetical protein